MKLLCVAIIFGAVLSVVYSSPPKYSSKYDNIDIDSILGNDKLLTSLINCSLDKGPCSKAAGDFRNVLPDALNTKCSRCTEPQKKMVRKAAKYLMEKKKPEWEEIKKKFDPKNEHADSFKNFMSES